MSISSKTSPPKPKSNPGQKGYEKADNHSALKNPLRSLNEDEFCDLGLEQVGYVRSISARDLAQFVAEAKSMPGEVQFQMIVGANGIPLLIADNEAPETFPCSC